MWCLTAHWAWATCLRHLKHEVEYWHHCQAVKPPLWPFLTIGNLISSFLFELKILFPDKQEGEHYNSLGLHQYNWVFSPSFSSLYRDSHWFFVLASFPKRNRDIITAAPQCQKMQNKPFFLPERLFVWKSLSCKLWISFCLSDCICRLIFACSRLFS